MDTETALGPALPDTPPTAPELPVVVEPQLPAPATTSPDKPDEEIIDGQWRVLPAPTQPKLPAPAPTKPGKPNEEIIDGQRRVLPAPLQPKLPASAPSRPAKATPAHTGFAFPSTNPKPHRMPAPVPLPGFGWMDGLFGALSSLVSALSLDWLFGPPSYRKPRYKPVPWSIMPYPLK